METIKSLDSLSFESLFLAFNRAFSDYEIQINREELSVMLSRRGFVPSLSFGLFEDDNLISFTVNGIGEFNGEKTAYDTGTGTLKDFRGKGLASKIFEDSIPFLKEAGISQYLLEVLQHNTGAVSVYKKLGFTVSREFNYFTQLCSSVKIPEKNMASEYRIGELSLERRREFEHFCDFLPSWQNGFEAILRRDKDFKVLGAFKGQEIVGYCIFEPVSGDVTQIAVERKHRRRGIASALLSEALKSNRHNSVKVINTEMSCESLTLFLNSCGIPLKGKQFEMIKKL
ncbi:MAG: GNAT family N-acetyltransferase [Bacteroidetes bacterium HGW-Bacteroidetes-10]|nr:MAG: GNAT family N-acetyltransferase [Bacteroidetes bacterium HGW-Bacteroidetes-10]